MNLQIPSRAVGPRRFSGILLNDVHSKLNETRVRSVLRPACPADLQWALQQARDRSLHVSCAGGRHAMGGQQFGAANLHLDLNSLDRVLQFDRHRGIVEVEAGIQWPKLVEWLIAAQSHNEGAWGIRQKQTGADRLSLGGALSANIHGRGLQFAPFAQDVESFVLLRPSGEMVHCSRNQNEELFRLAIGGYGLFGIVYSIQLRLARRQRLQRIVEVERVGRLARRFRERIRDGFLFGDFQFAIDAPSDDFLDKGIFSCYKPVNFSAPDCANHRELGPRDWTQLLRLAHVQPSEAFERYARHYLATNGQLYWSDTHQLAYYCDDYHHEIDSSCCSSHCGSEMITELYVPLDALASFIEQARMALRANGTPVIYGTIRLIEADTDTFLPWARRPSACIIFNLHGQHHSSGLARSADAFRSLITMALSFGGSFYLTYHRHATRTQLLQAYPELPRFLALKRRHDPDSILVSNWYRHLRSLFSQAPHYQEKDT